ncbi:MAG: type II secretion system protein [Oscillospiraceae bacterium]|jgi:prepilin-type N-terminal cleavage/methylation domain-containing protein
MVKNNKGFTLLELIISFAILAVVSASVLGFMGAGANIFRSVSSEAAIQYESQLTLAQLQEYVIDCNGGVFFDAGEKALFTLDTDGTSYTMQIFKLDGDELFFDRQDVVIGEDGSSLSYSSIGSAAYSPDLMASNITDFNVGFERFYDSGNGRYIATRAVVTLTLGIGGRDFTGTQEIAFRNSVIYADSLDNMLNKVIFG